MSGSGSGSRSRSFSSSEAIILHFTEAGVTLADGGFDVTEHAFKSIARALSEETVSEVAFWGVRREDRRTGLAEFRLGVDWHRHALVVDGGDRVDLPLGSDGKVNLRQVRRAAEAFLRGFLDQHLAPEIRVRYRPECQHRWKELNDRYGWSPGTPIARSGVGAGHQQESRYHGAVSLSGWFGF